MSYTSKTFRKVPGNRATLEILLALYYFNKKAQRKFPVLPVTDFRRLNTTRMMQKKDSLKRISIGRRISKIAALW
jgi:hypothetical protein